MKQILTAGGLCLALLLGAAGTAPANRDLAVTPRAKADSVPIMGHYWALIIGIDQYQQAPKLETAVRDATAVRDVLVARYGFAREHLVTLLNAEATRSNVEEAFYRLGRQAGPDDSVLIYYAGHGQYDAEGRLGWWVPVDAQPTHPGTFITNASIRDYISGMKAKHVYLVADSCFSGTLFGSRALPPLTDQWVARLYQKPSRWGLTSGSAEPVADRGKDGHSVFAYHFLTLLKENTEPYLVPSQIHAKLAPLVANNSDQTPRSEPLKGAGDEGGQFVFRLASVTSGATTVPPSLSTGSDSLAVERQQLEEERRRWKAERDQIDQARRQAEEQAKLKAERARMEVDRLQIEEERKALELARVTQRSRFVFYNGNRFDDPGMKREWTRVNDGIWNEAYPNGYVTTLKVLGRTIIEGVAGTHLGKLDAPEQEVFIPDKATGSTKLMWRQAGGTWRYIGDLRDVQ